MLDERLESLLSGIRDHASERLSGYWEARDLAVLFTPPLGHRVRSLLDPRSQADRQPRRRRRPGR